jgi:hypothetical protein
VAAPYDSRHRCPKISWEPEANGPGGERERSGQENVIMRSLVGVIAAAVIATMFVLPADARAKKPKRPAAVQTETGVALTGRSHPRPHAHLRIRLPSI